MGGKVGNLRLEGADHIGRRINDGDIEYLGESIKGKGAWDLVKKGFDSVAPYLAYPGKGAFLLCRTSNPGGDDLQNQRLASVDGQPLLYEHIAGLVQGPWNKNGQLGLVVGATYPAEIERVRALAPTVPLLIPGVGAQGGDAAATVRAGWRPNGPIVVNSSRAILYASNGADFAAAARREAIKTRDMLQAARPL